MMGPSDRCGSSARFLHTADWQLGKPFAGVEDPQKRSLLQNARLQVIESLGGIVRERQAEFVLVAGDLFDSPSATRSTVAAACSAIGSIPVAVYAIPGNHDHAGPGSLWEQPFFERERERLAPNLQMLLEPRPLELETAVILPCPLRRRHELSDPTQWLRDAGELLDRFGEKPRLVLAHGSVADFGITLEDDDEEQEMAVNRIHLDRLTALPVDFVALGDWHGTKQVGSSAWYSGTPEPDRFAKGADYDPGNVLCVEATRGSQPAVEPVPTASIGWHTLEFRCGGDASLDRLERQLHEQVGNRANRDLLRLELDGILGLSAASRLEEMIESWAARLIRLRFKNRTTLAPSERELERLTRRPADPLISRVARRLLELSTGADADQAHVARAALRELYAAAAEPPAVSGNGESDPCV